MKRENKKKKGKSEKPHFVAEIAYAPDQDWRSDFALGIKGEKTHGHMTLSGASIYYLRDQEGNEIVVDGVIIKEDEK